VNTVGLSQRLGRLLAVDDPALLPADAALDVLASINAGIQTFYRFAPDLLKRTTVSATLRPPQTLNVQFVGQYGNQITAGTSVSGSFFQPFMFGCTVLFSNGFRSEITGTSTILDNWLDSTLAATATVYYDVAPLDQLIEKITGPVRIFGFTGKMLGVLARDEALRERRHGWAGCVWEYGRPHRYCIDMVGIDQGANPGALLRVEPRPDEAYTIRTEAQLSPAQICFANLTNAVCLPVPAVHIESILIPLCEAELSTSEFWNDRTKKAATLAKAAEVTAKRLSRIPTDMAPGNSRCGIPRGY
jgi:hypothetical protein